jgi:hypothetical protein
MEPDLLSLQGRVDHAVLEAAVDAVESGRVPGWRVIYDRLRIEMVTGQSRQLSWQSLAGAAFGITQDSGQSPGRVWVVVLEDTTTGRRAVVKFLLVGGNEARPVWERIRADAGMPLPSRKRRLRPRRWRR